MIAREFWLFHDSVYEVESEWKAHSGFGPIMSDVIYLLFFLFFNINYLKTRCVCEIRMPPQRPSFENCDLDIRP